MKFKRSSHPTTRVIVDRYVRPIWPVLLSDCPLDVMKRAVLWYLNKLPKRTTAWKEELQELLQSRKLEQLDEERLSAILNPTNFPLVRPPTTTRA